MPFGTPFSPLPPATTYTINSSNNATHLHLVFFQFSVFHHNSYTHMHCFDCHFPVIFPLHTVTHFKLVYPIKTCTNFSHIILKFNTILPSFPLSSAVHPHHTSISIIFTFTPQNLNLLFHQWLWLSHQWFDTGKGIVSVSHAPTTSKSEIILRVE